MRWSMETLIGFRSKRIPDFIDVEIPTRWCESLEVSPTAAWSRQPATDPSRQIIRIRCDADELSGKIAFHSRLPAELRNRPSQRAVGEGLGIGPTGSPYQRPRSSWINEPIQWRTSAVEAVKLPDQWNESHRIWTRLLTLSGRHMWQPIPPGRWIWRHCLRSMWKQSLSVVTSKSLPRMMVRWQCATGTYFLEAWKWVDIRLPIGSTCLGAWTAGQAVVAEPLEREQSATEEPQTLRVPLSLSRLFSDH